MGDDIIARLNEVWEYAPTYPWQRNAINDAKAEIERLRAERDAVEALHQRKLIVYRPNDDHDVICNECDKPWPCRTYVLLHPEESRRG